MRTDGHAFDEPVAEIAVASGPAKQYLLEGEVRLEM
jgi:hypothetical protein